MRMACFAGIQRSQSGWLMRLSSIENFACSSTLIALPLQPSEPRPMLTPASSSRQVGCSPLPSRRLLTGLVTTFTCFSAASSMSRSVHQTKWASELLGPKVQVGDEAALESRRRHQSLGFGLQQMGMQTDAVTRREVAGQFQKPGRAALRPIDAKHETDAIPTAPHGGNLLHHGEIVIRQRRLHAVPAIPDIRWQSALVDRPAIDIALVFKH